MGAFCLHGNLDTCEVCRRELETDDDYAPIPTTGFAHVLPRDWPAFWQSLTAQETAAALRAAPRILCEWNGQGPSGECARFPMSEHDCIAYVVAKPWTDNRCRWYVVGADGEWEGIRLNPRS